MEVLPATYNYSHINREKVKLVNRDLIFWYGDKTFVKHFYNFLKLESVVVTLSVQRPISSKNLDREKLSNQTYLQIKNSYKPIV